VTEDRPLSSVALPSPHRDFDVRRDCVTRIEPVAIMTCTLAASPARQLTVLRRRPVRIVVGYFGATRAYRTSSIAAAATIPTS